MIAERLENKNKYKPKDIVNSINAKIQILNSVY